MPGEGGREGGREIEASISNTLIYFMAITSLLTLVGETHQNRCVLASGVNECFIPAVAVAMGQTTGMKQFFVWIIIHSCSHKPVFDVVLFHEVLRVPIPTHVHQQRLKIHGESQSNKTFACTCQKV